MTFRIEEKLHIAPQNKELFLTYLKNNNASKLYVDRFISSTYFDNENLDMFNHSEEGIVPRKKIRLRSYDKKPHHLTKTLYEIKISSVGIKAIFFLVLNEILSLFIKIFPLVGLIRP